MIMVDVLTQGPLLNWTAHAQRVSSKHVYTLTFSLILARERKDFMQFDIIRLTHYHTNQLLMCNAFRNLMHIVVIKCI